MGWLLITRDVNTMKQQSMKKKICGFKETSSLENKKRHIMSRGTAMGSHWCSTI